MAFGVDLRAERFAVIEVRAPIPLAVPGVEFDVSPQLFGLGDTTFGKRRIISAPGQLRELGENIVQEKSQPDTLPTSLFAYEVHSIVPIPATHQGQAIGAKFEGAFYGANTMFIKRGR